MSTTTQGGPRSASGSPGIANLDMPLEVLVVPVSDPGNSVAHGEHEKRIGHADADCPAWYATYMIAEQSG